MKFEKGELISEIEPEGSPGNYGNSMAETSRYSHLALWKGSIPAFPVELLNFRTSSSYIESRSTYLDGLNWPVSTDQCLPWYLAVSKSVVPLAPEMNARLEVWGWKTPDNNLISPMFYAVLKGNMFLLNMFVGLQAIIFKLPWRWNDQKEVFESSTDSSADYLNWFHCSLYCNKWIRRLVSKETLIKKIEDYYKPEPNVQWLIDLYKEVINATY